MQPIPDNMDYTEAEHICLEGDSAEATPNAVTESVEFRIQLKRRTHGSEQTVTVYDSGRIDVDTSTRKAERHRHRIDARHLDATPRVERYVARRTLITALVTGTFSVLFLVLPLWLAPLGPWQLPAGILLATTSLFALILGVYRTGETVSFPSRHGRVPVITIQGGIRCGKRCAPLSQALNQAATRARENTDDAHLLRDEMREHHRLKTEGVLETEAYEAAKLRILSAHG